MRVKELLLQALSRANHIEDGSTADAREITKAMNFFRSALSKYSSSNLMTAFQKMTDIVYAERQTIGKYNLKKGRVMHEAQNAESLPDPTRLTAGKDFGHAVSSNEWFRIAQVEGVNTWMDDTVGDTPEEKLRSLGCCDYVPDVIVNDMERIMSCMFRMKGQSGAFCKMNFVPLVNFFTDYNETTYCSNPVGENKVELLLPPGMENYDFKIVYYSEMELGENSYIELPEAYKELLTLAVTVGLLSEDADSDPKQLDNYSAQLRSMEDLIGSTNVTTRRLTRENDSGCLDALHTGSFIRRRFSR